MKFLNSDSNLNFFVKKDITMPTLKPSNYIYNEIDSVGNVNNGNLSSIVELVLSNVTQISGIASNLSSEMEEEEEFSENNTYIFDRLDVRIIFITLYSLVFCCCFFGEFYFLFTNIFTGFL